MKVAENKKIMFLISMILVLMISITSTTYAYLEFSNDNSNMVGVTGNAVLSLNVSRVTPSSNTGVLIPQSEDTLATAVSSNYNCVDDNDNVVCHIYKIDVQNIGTTATKIRGYINFTNPSMPNLKYRLMDSATTLNTKTGMYAYEDMDRPLVNGISIGANATKTYYVVMWIDLDDSSDDMSQTDNGDYRATFHFEASEAEGVTSTFVNYLVANNNTNYFRSDTYREKIKNIAFVDYIDTSNAVETWDMGTLQDGGIIAWVDTNESDSNYYDLYIGSNDIIYGKNMKYFFSDMKNIDSISFDNLDTSQVTNMMYMFWNTGYNSTIFTLDLGDNFDTSNVTTMVAIFFNTGYSSPIFTLNLGDKFDTSSVTSMNNMFDHTGYTSNNFVLNLGDKFDTSSVTSMNAMFYGTGYNSLEIVLDLGDKFDTSNVTNMSQLFRNCGYKNTNFTLDLGEKFDTSNVINMANLFREVGYASTIFTLDLGDKFDTSNVTSMESLFRSCGYKNTNFTLDLGEKFDTSNVINMANLFREVGYNSTIFTLDLGDKFDTSNAIDISYMFYYAGYNNETFTLDLGDKFDTSNVTSMASMFNRTGYNSKVFTLDLGDKFDTSNVTDIIWMFNYTGYSSPIFTLDFGDKFDTSKVTNMHGMFWGVGNSNPNFELDLTSFTFDNVTNYYGTFAEFKSTQKIYVKNESDKETLLNAGGMGNLSTNNVIVKS